MPVMEKTHEDLGHKDKQSFGKKMKNKLGHLKDKILGRDEHSPVERETTSESRHAVESHKTVGSHELRESSHQHHHDLKETSSYSEHSTQVLGHHEVPETLQNLQPMNTQLNENRIELDIQRSLAGMEIEHRVEQQMLEKEVSERIIQEHQAKLELELQEALAKERAKLEKEQEREHAQLQHELQQRLERELHENLTRAHQERLLMEQQNLELEHQKEHA